MLKSQIDHSLFQNHGTAEFFTSGCVKKRKLHARTRRPATSRFPGALLYFATMMASPPEPSLSARPPRRQAGIPARFRDGGATLADSEDSPTVKEKEQKVKKRKKPVESDSDDVSAAAADCSRDDVSQSRHAYARAGTHPDDSEIVRLWASGASWPAIAAALGRDVGCQRAKDRWKNCLKNTPAGKEACKSVLAADSEIVRLWAGGESWPDIAAALGRDVGCRRAMFRWHHCLKTSPAGKEAVLTKEAKVRADSEIVRLVAHGQTWPAITAALGRHVGCRRAENRWHNSLKTSPAGKEEAAKKKMEAEKRAGQKAGQKRRKIARQEKARQEKPHKEEIAIATGYHRPLAEQRQALDLGVPLVTKQYGKQMQVPLLSLPILSLPILSCILTVF